MNPERLHFLLSAYMDGALLPEEKSELEDALRRSASARTQFWEQTLLHDQLRVVVGETRQPLQLHQPGVRNEAGAEPVSNVLNLLRRPFTALAAGIVLSALCTSALWAYAGQRLGGRTKPLLLLIAGFEDAPAVPARGVPDRPGTWSGDYNALVGAQNGVVPHSGRTMLRFLRADNALGSDGPASYVAEAIHVVDLRPYGAELRTGRAHVEIGAWFAGVATTEERQVRFLLKSAAFTGSPAEAPAVWKDAGHASLSMVQKQVDFSPIPGEWKPLTISISIPPQADFLVFECAAMQVRPKVREGTAEFPGHYLDDVFWKRSAPNATTAPLTRGD
jgi:hypothetical protein